jgi:hypothetical protein
MQEEVTATSGSSNRPLDLLTSLLAVDMSSKAGGDDTWQSQTGRNSSAKGSKRMGMAYCISF